MEIGVSRGCNDVERRTTFGDLVSVHWKNNIIAFTLLHWYK